MERLMLKGRIVNIVLRDESIKRNILKEAVQLEGYQYNTLVSSNIISIEEIINMDIRFIEHVRYIDEYLNLLGINKVTTGYIKEDIRDAIYDLEFDIVVYINNITILDRYHNISKTLLNNSDIDSRKLLYTKIESTNGGKEMHATLQRIDKLLGLKRA